MAHINLLPSSVQHQRKIDLLNYYTLTAGMVTVIGAVVFSGLLLLFDQVYQINLNSVKDEKKQAEAAAAVYLDTEKKATDLQQQLEGAKRAESQTTHWTSLLTTLQALTPPRVAIDSFTVSPASAAANASKTAIAGTADSRRSLGEFQVALASSPFVKSANIETSSLDGAGITYKIALEINYDKLNGPLK